VDWAGFGLPPEIPDGATITEVYGVADVSLSGQNAILFLNGSSLAVDPFTGSVSRSLGTSLPASFNLTSVCTLPLGGSTGAVTFVGAAVYYLGTPKTKYSLIYEALNDIRLGGPVKIWYGLMANGALIGTPYLIFKGTVDKPSVKVDDKSASITLACENRLVDLQRANQRRYTSADQKLAYPTDMAFNWVETLNDIALRWGG
jgi:hypothetical protein